MVVEVGLCHRIEGFGRTEAFGLLEGRMELDRFFCISVYAGHDESSICTGAATSPLR